MKILFVNFTKFWGGGESWTYQLMDELKKRGHSIILFSNNQSKLLNKAQDNGIITYSFDVKKISFLNPFLYRKLTTSLKEQEPDAVFLNSTLELKTIGLALKSCNCNHVVFNRGIPSPIKLDPFKKYLFTQVVSDIVVNSIYVKKKLADISLLMRREPTVIYHGINTEPKYVTTGKTKNIAIVGRLSWEKGVDIALTVFQKVLSSHTDAKLWIIGTGKEMNNLQKQSTKLGISDSVCFLGHINNVEKLLVQCSVLIMTSRWEGFGLVLLEAMKLKIPCIAFNHIAANEIIINNESGFLIPEMDINLMAQKITYILDNKQLSISMGEKGHEILIEKFSMEHIIDQHENLLLKYKL